MSGFEKMEELETKIDSLTAQISDGFPVISGGANDPMIDGLGALRDLLDELLVQMRYLAETVEWYGDEVAVLGKRDALPQAVNAAATVLTLDGGRRARRALKKLDAL